MSSLEFLASSLTSYRPAAPVNTLHLSALWLHPSIIPPHLWLLLVLIQSGNLPTCHWNPQVVPGSVVFGGLMDLKKPRPKKVPGSQCGSRCVPWGLPSSLSALILLKWPMKQSINAFTHWLLIHGGLCDGPVGRADGLPHHEAHSLWFSDWRWESSSQWAQEPCRARPQGTWESELTLGMSLHHEGVY